MKRHTNILAKLALLTATIIWGTTFFIMEGTIENIGIFSLLAFRFFIAGALLLIFLSKSLKKLNRKYLICGFILGAFNILAYTAQTYGLKDPLTTPGKNAFLTAIYCILVPFIFWAVAKKRPDGYNIISALLCLFGITLVSMSGSDFSTICKGDVLTLLGGVFFACHMVCVSIFSKKYDILLLTMLQLLSAGVISLICAFLFDSAPGHLSYETVVSALYLAVFATCICYILQNVGQKFTSPATSALILSLEAVFGIIFSIIFTSEKLTPRLFAGFVIIFIAILLSEIKPKFFKFKKS